MKALNALLIFSFFAISFTLSAQTDKDKTRRFNIIDSDRNEVITIREMKKYYKGKTNKDGEPMDAKKIFYGLDANRNSIITLNEYIKGVDWKLAYEYVDRWEYKPKEEEKELVSDVSEIVESEKFDKIDSNLDQVLTQIEVVNFYRGMTNKKTGRPINGKLNFYTYDSNNDGSVTLEEFNSEYNWKEGWNRMKEAEGKSNNSNDKPSEAYLQKRIELFEEIDVDENFKVSLEELTEYYKNKMNNQGKPVNAEFQLYGLDKDEDGLVSLSEFASKIDVELAKRRYKEKKQ